MGGLILISSHVLLEGEQDLTGLLKYIISDPGSPQELMKLSHFTAGGLLNYDTYYDTFEPRN